MGSDRGSLTDESQDPKREKEMKGWFLEPDHFVLLFNAKERRVFCLMEQKELPALQHEGLKEYHVVKQGFGKILISNQ